MNLSLKIARRYLLTNTLSGILFVVGFMVTLPLSLFSLFFFRHPKFKKLTKSINAINVISGVSVFGIMVGSAALILVLSVFNGFGDFISSLYNAFNPDVKITAVEGKVFVPDSTQLDQIIKLEGVIHLSQTLEENAMFEYKKRNDFGIIKGVDMAFPHVTRLDTTVKRGIYSLQEQGYEFAVLGQGMEYKLGVNVEDMFEMLAIYMPKRTGKSSSMSNPLKKKFVKPAGVFAVYQNDFDDQYVFVSIDFARDILSYKKGEVSALELKFAPGANEEATLREIKSIMGEGFFVKNRYEQDEAFFRIMKIEKWMAYIILSFTLLLVAFNMIGSLWMLVMEKKHDISILKSMGATPSMVRNIFLYEGMMLSVFGMLVGFAIATILCLLQQYYGLISLQGGDAFVVQSYPVSLRFRDYVLVFFTVLFIGAMSSLLPALRAGKIPAMIRED